MSTKTETNGKRSKTCAGQWNTCAENLPPSHEPKIASIGLLGRGKK